MLRILDSSDIAAAWPLLKKGLTSALPPITYESPERMTNILAALQKGTMQAWIAYPNTTLDEVKEDPKDLKPLGIIVTTMTYDEPSKITNFEIYALASVKNQVVQDDVWRDGLEALRDYARKAGCSHVTAYTREPRILNLVHQLGGTSEYTFVRFDVNPTAAGFSTNVEFD